MAAHPRCPVHPVAIEGAPCAFYFNVRFDAFCFMFVKRPSILTLKGPSSLLTMPIFVGYPVMGLVVMASFRPAPQFEEGEVVSFAEGLAGLFAAVVIRPTPDDGIE